MKLDLTPYVLFDGVVDASPLCFVRRHAAHVHPAVAASVTHVQFVALLARLGVLVCFRRQIIFNSPVYNCSRLRA